MPNKRSAAKRARQALVRQARNKAARSEIRTYIKQARAAVEAGDVEQARELARQAESQLAKAAKKGIVHKNNAQRRAQRLQRAVAQAARGAATE